MARQDWVWMPCAGHFICARYCRYHLNTYVNGYIVSTIGEYCPDRDIRRMNVEVHNSSHPEDQFDLSLMGDVFDYEYQKKFGFESFDAFGDSFYETLVFKAQKIQEESCCPYQVTDWSELDGLRYEKGHEAYNGHLQFCEKCDKGEIQEMGNV